MRSPIPASWSPYLLSVLRIIAAFLFIAHGTQKLFGFPSAGPQNTVELVSWFGLAGILEAFGGALVLLGVGTRPVAFILAGEMAVAYVWKHAGGGFWPLLNHGEPAVFFCFAFLYVAAAGPGPWSVDALMSKNTAPK